MAKRVKFDIFDCVAKKEMYYDGNTCIQLYDEEGPVATATVNLGGKLKKDEAYIKTYSENAGMFEALVDAGIVTEVIGYGQAGYVMVPLCKLNLEGL